MNTPYVTQYDEKGLVVNPIVGIYPSEFPNRRKRNEKDPRFRNNRAAAQMVVGPSYRYKKRIQITRDKETGAVKRVQHYDLVK